MALEGSIQDFGLTDIIQFLRHQTKTGVLSVQSNERWTKIYFKDGMIVSTATSEAEGIDWLFNRLLRSGRISEAQLNQIREDHREPGRFETGLQEAELITQQDLRRFFEIQNKETLFSLFRLKEGTYHFESTSVDFNEAHITPMNADFILLEGMRQLDEWPMIKKQINNGNVVFEKKQDLIDKVSISQEKDISFGEETTQEEPKHENYLVTGNEMAVYQLMDGQRNIQQLVDRALLGEFETYQAILKLVSKGLVHQKVEAVAKTPVKLDMTVPKEEPAGETSSVSLLWNTILFVIVIAWIAMITPKFIDTFLSFQVAGQIVDDEVSKRKLLEINEAINIYYYKNKGLPMNLNELTLDVPESQPIVDYLSTRGLRYEKEGQGFTVTMPADP